jgi:hypothetical protein
VSEILTNPCTLALCTLKIYHLACEVLPIHDTNSKNTDCKNSTFSNVQNCKYEYMPWFSNLSASVPVMGRQVYKMMVLASDWSLNDACLREKAESPWSNLIHIIELSTSLKLHYWVSNGQANWVRTLVPVRPWACSVSTSHPNSHLWVLIQLSAQIQPVRTVSWTLYKQHCYSCSALNLRCWDHAVWIQSGLKNFVDHDSSVLQLFTASTGELTTMVYVLMRPSRRIQESSPKSP